MPKRKRSKKGEQVKSTETEKREDGEGSHPFPEDDEQDGMWLHPSEVKKMKLVNDNESESEKPKKNKKSKRLSPVQDEGNRIEVEVDEEDNSEVTKPKKKKKYNMDDDAEITMEIEEEEDAEPTMPKKKKKNNKASSPTVLDDDAEMQVEEEEGAESTLPKKKKKRKKSSSPLTDEEIDTRIGDREDTESVKQKKNKQKDQISDSEILENIVQTEELSETTKKKKKKKSKNSPCETEDSLENVTEMEEAKKSEKLKKSNSETENSVDVNDLRDEYESNAEWGIRSQFIEAHLDSFPLDRLISLSKCFVYNEIFGCVYPIQVMNLVKSLREPLAGSIPKPIERLKSQYSVSFVKSSETSSKKADKNTTENKGMINFVKAGESYESLNFSKEVKEKEEEENQRVENLDPKEEEFDTLFNNMQARSAIEEFEGKFAEVGKNIKKLEKKHNADPISRLYEAAQKCKLVVTSETDVESNGSKCRVFLNGVLVGTGQGKNKKIAKINGHTDANVALMRPYKKFDGHHPKKITFVSSEEPFEKEEVKTSNDKKTDSAKETLQIQPMPNSSAKPDMKQLEKLKNSFPNFYVRELGYYRSDAVNYRGMLVEACGFQQVKTDLQTETISDNEVRCRLYLEGDLITEATRETEMLAKQEASRVVFEMLKDVFWTMLFKTEADSDGDRLSKEEMIKDEEEEVKNSEHGDKLTDSNIGCKLLRKMGWSGKGVGKNEQGREEPVLVKQVIRRNGLGQDASTDDKFKANVHKLIMDYIRSDRDDDLAFAPDFSNDERKHIHLLCRKNGLKSKSYGKEDERYLVIFRQRNKDELLDYVRSKGGETNKYKLVPPRLECFR